ncbi:hypothetical protein [Lysobacter humi (ex Lee et al. 2017)]
MTDPNRNDRGTEPAPHAPRAGDAERRDSRGGSQSTQEPQRAESASERTDESGLAKDDISRAPESGTP